MSHAVVVMYDAPSNVEFEEWMHGPHYDEVLATPGVTAVQRFEVTDGPADRRKYVAIIHTTDIEATLAWRSGIDGQRSQEEANARGVNNRYGLVCRTIFDSNKI
ncbi:MAG: hypothetical protein J0H71_05985 [Rhizobiales bacterium]|nr:hypothetical protein [Hyphomicrobiales bacterium]